MTGRLEGRLIGLGVCGSIAAYKAVELVRLLRAEGADVVVMLTPSAATFVGPLTFQALSRHAVETDVLGLLPDQRIGHIVVADTADAIVVAPATARWLGAMANGIANDAVTATCLATRRRSCSRRRWTATCGRTARRATTSSGCSATSATGWCRRRRAARLGPGGRRPPRGAAADRRRGGRGHRRRAGPPAGRRGAAAARRRAPRARPRRPARRRERRRHGGADRPRPVHRQPQHRADGRRDRRGRPGARGPRDDRRGPGRGRRCPRRATVVHAERTAEMRDAVLDAVLGRADALVMAAAVADFRPATAATTKLDPGRRPDPRARADRGHPRRGRRRARARRSTRGPSSSGSRRRRARSSGRPRSCAARARTCSSPTTSASRARASAPTPTGSSILGADGSRDDLPLLTKREVADRLLDRVVALLDEPRRRRDAHWPTTHGGHA